ncbi:hypothetical protein COV15_02675 [Candidatus Woesearchaeota archaeon CG10_big_fil_rev_8_21_14_0_10_34_12]|nr:MAG: hypothetical protein COV15_02675 [Candidatus Woesearchaeota archaeon CG10_big_fil_rev_8_21_14_0_10_34_12]
MSEMKNKLRWCLKKAEKELKEGKKHRGLVVSEEDIERAREHIKKAEHYLEATLFLKEGFSDIGASTAFYAIYHSFLAILAKYGYESRNQECTFVTVYSLIEDKKIDLGRDLVDKISLMKSSDESSIVEIRESYQYGTELSMQEKLYDETIEIAKKILGKAKTIIEI